MNDASLTHVKNFDFDSNASANIFSYLYISYMANQRSQVEEQFHSKSYCLGMPCSHPMHLKSAPQQLNFVMTNI